jgi:hypothetical protein
MRRANKVFALGAALAAAAGPASAALPPNYQRIAELKAVLGHIEVGRAFGLQPIDRIELLRTDVYRVTAGRCRLDVAIIDLPTPGGVAGGRRFEARPGRKVCGR